jgi:hypothetical protein
LLEECIDRHLKSRATPHGFAGKELSAVISLQDDQEWFNIRLHMLVPPNTIMVARGKSNQLQSAIELLLPKLKNTIKRELTFLRSQGDLPYSYPATQDILDEVIAGVISDWKPGLDDNDVYIRLLQEMNEVLSGEVAASHVYGDNVSLEATAPKNAMEHAESMVGEEFYEFYQPDELLKIEDLVFDEKSLMLLEKDQDDQKIF